MKRNIIINEEATLSEVLGTRTHHACKPVINKTTGDTYASATDAADALGVTIWAVSQCCLGKQKTCKGNKLEYVKSNNGNVDSLTAEIRILKAKLAEMEADAAVGRAIREEREAAQKAEEDRLKAIEDTKTALVKANERKERRKRIVEQKDADLQKSVSRLMDTEREIEELTMKLLELEGVVKVNNNEIKEKEA